MKVVGTMFFKNNMLLIDKPKKRPTYQMIGGKVEEGESETSYDFIQGQNTWNSNCYGGPCPPDSPHSYRLTAYALSCDLDIRGYFSYELLQKQMKGKILAECETRFIYDN